MSRENSKKKITKASNNFKSVARRLGCDEDKASFEKKLGKIAKAKASPVKNRSSQ
jgi:hypothetical protein